MQKIIEIYSKKAREKMIKLSDERSNGAQDLIFEFYNELWNVSICGKHLFNWRSSYFVQN